MIVHKLSFLGGGLRSLSASVETGLQCISKVLLFLNNLGLIVHKNRFCQLNSLTGSLLKNQKYQW